MRAQESFVLPHLEAVFRVGGGAIIEIYPFKNNSAVIYFVGNIL